MTQYRAKVVRLGAKIDELNATYDEQLDAFERMLAERPPAEAPGVDIAPITALYPGFNDQQFLAVARETYYQMAEAWEHRDVAIADGLCGRELFEDLRTHIRNDIAADRIHLLPGVEVHDAAIVSATVADKTATIVVRLNVIGREYYANDHGDIVEGDDQYRKWIEDWTYRRDPDVDATVEDRRHALTPHDKGGWDFAHNGWDAVAISRTGAADLK